MFRKITIIGVGLIGGSLGMAIKKVGLSREVVGLTRHRATLKNARRLGAIDRGTLELSEAVKDAELVVIAAPVADIPRIASSVARKLKQGSIITDVGSAKSRVVSQVEKNLPRGIYFIGGHPMAGSEKKGVREASPGLFKNSVCFLTRTKRTNLGALEVVKSVWRKVGARVQVVSPAKHDQIVAKISHLPHLAAFNLAAMVEAQDLKYAAGGFGDTTRIASSNPAMWRDIYLANSKELVKALDSFINSLKKTKNLILRRDCQKILNQLKRAKSKRDAYGRR